jgi:hypothetical protein
MAGQVGLAFLFSASRMIRRRFHLREGYGGRASFGGQETSAVVKTMADKMAGQSTRERASAVARAMSDKARKICLRHWYAQIATNFPSKKFVDLRVSGHGGTPI